jgi:hypothetical protein
MTNQPNIIFVYNANGGFFNGVSDYIHKFVSPDTYECNLCTVTYDNLGMKKLWKTYISNLELPTRFLHKDEFSKEFPKYSDHILPVILIQNGNKLEKLLSNEELNSLRSQEILIEIMKTKLKEIKRFIYEFKC